MDLIAPVLYYKIMYGQKSLVQALSQQFEGLAFFFSGRSLVHLNGADVQSVSFYKAFGYRDIENGIGKDK